MQRFKNIYKFLANIYMEIIAIIFMVSNFIIFNLNYMPLQKINFEIYHYFYILILVAIILNLYKINIFKLFKENIFFIMIISILLYNSQFIDFNFNGIHVDLGRRSTDLIKQLVPPFFAIIVLYRYANLKSIKVAFNLSLILILIYSIIGIYGGYYKVESLFNLIPIKIAINNRYYSVLTNPNAFGEYTFIGIYLSLFLFLVYNKKITRFLYLLFIPILSIGMFLSISRTSMLMFCVLYLSIHIYYRYIDKVFKRFLIFGDIAIISTSLFIYFNKKQEFLKLIRFDEGSNGRSKIWSYIITQIKDNFDYGVGFNNSSYILSESKLFPFSFSAHNMYLGLLFEFGIIAFIICMIWFLYLLITNHIAIINNKNNYNIKYLIMCNLFYMSFLIGQIYEFSFLRVCTMNSFILIIIALNYKIKDQINNKKDDYKPKLLVLFIIFAFTSYLGQMLQYNLTKIVIMNIVVLIIVIIILFKKERILKSKK